MLCGHGKSYSESCGAGINVTDVAKIGYVSIEGCRYSRGCCKLKCGYKLG